MLVVTHLVGFPAPIRKLDGFVPPDYTLIPLKHRHVTLVYLGHLDEVRGACEKLSYLQYRSFAVEFKGLQPFPSTARPRFLAAVPVKRDEHRLREVRDRLSSIFIASADRYAEFRPHVSIAFTRRKPDLGLLRAVERAVKASSAATERLLVDRFCLMSAAEGSIEAVCCVHLQGVL